MKGVDGGGEGGEGNISRVCEFIGHRPLRGRCPKRMDEKNIEDERKKTYKKKGNHERILNVSDIICHFESIEHTWS